VAICGLSGGVDSTVARFWCIGPMESPDQHFREYGMPGKMNLRQTLEMRRDRLHSASSEWMLLIASRSIKRGYGPEEKRKRIGRNHRRFCRRVKNFQAGEAHAKLATGPGHSLSDVIESVSVKGPSPPSKRTIT